MLAAVQHAALSATFANLLIPAAAIIAIAFAILLWVRVSRVKVGGGHGVRSENGREYLLEEEQRGEDEASLKLSRPSHRARTDLCIVRMSLQVGYAVITHTLSYTNVCPGTCRSSIM